MKLLPTCLFALLLSQVTFAQQSIGFSDSTDFQYLINYRFPSWGYSQFSLNVGSLSLNGNNSLNMREDEQNGDYLKSTSNSYDERFSIAPSFTKYFESENKIYRVNSNFQIQNRLSGSNNDTKRRAVDPVVEEYEKSEYQFIANEFSYYASGDLKQYIKGDIFLSARLSTSVGYYFDKSDREDSDENFENRNTKTRNLSLVPTIGFGIGRIRNVTNVLRAIRLKERYSTISGSSLTNEEIIQSAEHFAKYQSYQRTYDRPQKYFWNDLNNVLNDKLNQISTFDHFYLNDVFNEQLGSRYEGYQINFLVRYTYSNYLIKNEREDQDEIVMSRNLDMNRSAAFDLNLEYYKNLNLKNQIHVSLQNAFTSPLERDNNFDYYFRSDLEMGWLYVIADRWHINNTFRTSYSKYKEKERYDVDDRRTLNLDPRLNTHITYFIENKMSITSSISLSDDYNYMGSSVSSSEIQKYNRFSWGFQISFNYFFTRNLF